MVGRDYSLGWGLIFCEGVDGMEEERKEVYNCTIPMHERSSICFNSYLEI